MKNIIIIIPVYNEGKNIIKVFDHLQINIKNKFKIKSFIDRWLTCYMIVIILLILTVFHVGDSRNS